MFDVFGFIATIAGFIFAHQNQIDLAIMQNLTAASEQTGLYWDHLRLFYDRTLARRTVWMLVISAIVDIVAYFFAESLAHQAGIDDIQWPAIRVLAGLCLLAKMAYAWYQWPARPVYLMENGRIRRHPRFRQNDQGVHVGQNGAALAYPDGTPVRRLNGLGQVFRYYEIAQNEWRDANNPAARFAGNPPVLLVNGQPQQPPVNLEEVQGTEVRGVRHGLADSPMFDLDAPHANRFGRHSFLKSFALVMGSHLMMSSMLIWMGLRHGLRGPMTLGGVEFAIALAMLYASANALAWLVDRGSKFLEFMATTLGQQALLPLIGITSENVRSVLTRVELINEQLIAGILKSSVVSFAATFLLFFVPSWIFKSATLSEVILSIIFVQALLDARCVWVAQDEGRDAVQKARRNLALAMRRWAAPVMVLIAVWGLHDGGRWDQTKLTLQGHVAWITDFFNGDMVAGIGPGPWSALGKALLGLIVLLVFGLLGFRLMSKEGLLRKNVGRVLAAFGLIVGGWLMVIGILRLDAHMEGRNHIAMPYEGEQVRALVTAPQLVQPPSAPKDLVVTARSDNKALDLVWTETGPNTGFEIQRREKRNSEFVTIGNTPANVTEYSDESAIPEKIYIYQVRSLNGKVHSEPCVLPTPEKGQEVKLSSANKVTVQSKRPAAGTGNNNAHLRVAQASPDDSLESCKDPAWVDLYRDTHGGKNPACLGQ